MEKKAQQQLIGPLINIFIIVVIVLALFFEGKGINLATDLFSRILISLLYSIVAGAIVGLIPLGPLRFGNISIFGFRFNLIVAILTFIVKIWLF